MSPRKAVFGAIFAVSALCSTAAQGITIISDVGDRDGFNGTYDPDSVVLPFHIVDFNSVPVVGGEAPFTDAQEFSESSDPTYLHTFVLPTGFVIDAVDFEIVTFDNASQAQGGFPSTTNGTILVDGVELTRGGGQDFFFDAEGEFCPDDSADASFVNGCVELFSQSLASTFFADFLDGSVVVTYDGSAGDGVAVDYSRLTITGHVEVPEPHSLALLALGIALVPLARRDASRSQPG